MIEKGGLLGIADIESTEKGIMNVDLYEEIDGEYFPLLNEANEYYSHRPDGKIEKIRILGDKTYGEVVDNMRGKIR